MLNLASDNNELSKKRYARVDGDGEERGCKNRALRDTSRKRKSESTHRRC